MKKGVVHIFAILTLAVIFSLSSITIAAIQRTHDLNRGKVLSEKSGGGDSGSHGGDSGSSGSSSSGSSASGSSGGSGSSSSGSSSSSSSGGSSSKTQTTTNLSTTPTKTITPKTEAKNKIETENETKTKAQLPKDLSNLKFSLEKHGTRLVIKIKDEEGKEKEVAENEVEKVENEIENELEKKDLKVSTSSAGLVVSKNQTSAATTFPVSVDLATNQLQVTTPKGQKDLAILPDQAVANILGKQITSVSQIELTFEKDSLAYRIKGLRDKKLFGLIPVTTAVETEVSAQNGQVIQTQQNFFDRVVNLFSI